MVSLTIDEALAVAEQAVGVMGPLETLMVTARDIGRFALAIGDLNPLYRDPEFARSTRWGGIIAPPTFLCVLMPTLPAPPIDYGSTLLNGGMSYRSFRPVRPGDLISGQAHVAEVRAVSTSRSPLLIQEREYTYRDESGSTVAIRRATAIHR